MTITSGSYRQKPHALTLPAHRAVLMAHSQARVVSYADTLPLPGAVL